jgi:ComF family protein
MTAVRALLDLLLPPVCPGCGHEGEILCERCRAPLYRRLAEPPGAPLGLPMSMPHGIVQLEWCATYSGSVREAIHALKYRGERRLAHPLASALAGRWRAAGRGAELVTWVPVHPSRRRERGFDQAEELARHMARALSLPVAPLLARSQRTAAQHALGQAQRASNTAGAFIAADGTRAHLDGRWVLVVDDILTTGATLAGCAAALSEAGALCVSAIALARDR